MSQSLPKHETANLQTKDAGCTPKLKPYLKPKMVRKKSYRKTPMNRAMDQKPVQKITTPVPLEQGVSSYMEFTSDQALNYLSDALELMEKIRSEHLTGKKNVTVLAFMREMKEGHATQASQ